ncbi:unnamed protein product, partial [Ixodes pacificus]
VGIIIDGKAISQNLLNGARLCVEELRVRYGLVPSLVVVIVGDDPASKLYVGNKQKKAEALGLESKTLALPATVSQDELLSIISRLNVDASVHGILVQLPLPKHIDKTMVINSINPDKDVDGFHNANAGKLATGQLDCMIPCTPQGCVYLIKTVRPKLSGSNVVVLGRSNIVGKPVALLLLGENCTVTILHSCSTDMEGYCARADIIVVAVGRAKFLQSSWVKPGAIVIDVGINLITEGEKKRFVGDIDFEGVKETAFAVTPVPGGVGPMTIAFLILNTLR